MNWPLEEFDGKEVIFVGKGRGRSMAGIETFLREHARIKSFTGVDKDASDEPLGFLRKFDSVSTVFIKNEGIPGTEMPVAYITPLQLFFKIVPLSEATTIGITGSKGKSTTAALTAHILQTAGKSVVLAGNIGISPLSALDSATKDTFFVLELSGYQLSDLRVSPHISACTNLYNDHTDWHGSLEEYWEAKHNIMSHAGPRDTFIYNPDFPLLREWSQKASCRCIPIDPSEQLDLSNSHLFGDHNRLNALIARQIVRECSISDDVCQMGINSFETLKHRMEVVAVKDTITYIDDAIGMTPEATLAGLEAITDKFGQIGCLLLGGQDRNYDFKEVIGGVAKAHVPSLVLFPDTEVKMKACFPDDYHPAVLETKSMKEAVVYASQNAPSGSVVLLSTAAPSFSLWKDFEEKGDQFQAAVSDLS
jgi:UDP-N-acetylmuramoylalanine--D-glutamate ligase